MVMEALLALVLSSPLEGCPPLGAVALREEAYRSYVIGQVHANEGRFADALAPLQGAIGADPLLAQARYALGQVLLGLRRFPEAVDAFSACQEVFRCLAALGAPQRAEIEQRLDRNIRELNEAIRSLQSGDEKTRAIPWMGMNRSAGRSRAETAQLLHQLELGLAGVDANPALWEAIRKRKAESRGPSS